MSRRTAPKSRAAAGGPGSPQEVSDAVNAAEQNGVEPAALAAGTAATPETPAADGAQAATPRMRRAEQIADNIGRKLRYLAARTREALSDFWADVQNIRHGEGSQDSPK